MNYLPRIPTRPPLAGAIEVLFSLSEYTPEHAAERLVPNGRATLVIELDGRERFVLRGSAGNERLAVRGAWLSGVQAGHITIGDTSEESRLVAVQFAPGHALAFVHESLAGFADRVVPCPEAFGEGLLALREELLAMEDAEAVLDRVEAWLIDRHAPEHAAPQVVRMVMGELLANPADVQLTSLVEERGGVSYKHFVELFKRHVGQNPKTMQRILRFARVFERIQEHGSLAWADLSLELGYADQAHLVRDFRAFSGYQPRRFVEAGHERLNFFPEELPGDRISDEGAR